MKVSVWLWLASINLFAVPIWVGEFRKSTRAAPRELQGNFGPSQGVHSLPGIHSLSLIHGATVLKCSFGKRQRLQSNILVGMADGEFQRRKAPLPGITLLTPFIQRHPLMNDSFVKCTAAKDTQTERQKDNGMVISGSVANRWNAKCPHCNGNRERRMSSLYLINSFQFFTSP